MKRLNKRICWRRRASLLPAVLTLLGCVAQGDESITLPRLIEQAETHNAAVIAARLRWDAALQSAIQARGWPDPKVTYGYFIEPIETRVGPQEHRIGISQPLLWFGRLKAAGDVASQEAAAALADYEATRLGVIQQVKDTWYELEFLGHSRAILQQKLSLVKELEAVAQTRFRAGGDLSDVTRAQVELGQLGDRLESLEALRTPLESRLNALLNQPHDRPLPPFTNSSPAELVLPDKAILFGWQQQSSPILDALNHQVQKADSTIRVARKSGLPNMSIGVDYVVTGSARMPGITDSGQDAIMAMLTVDLPIWRGKHTAAVRAARARRDAAVAQREDRSNQLATDLEMAIYNHGDAARKVALYADTLAPQARSALNVTRQSYEAGSTDFSGLIDAQRVLLEFELEHRRALANRAQALSRIELLVGREIAEPAQPMGTQQ